MSTNTPRPSKYPTMPTGTEVASYREYEQAVAAVDLLAADDFPVANVSIVGSNLHMVEQVVGKLTPGRVAMAGATKGLTWGMLLGLFTLVLVQDAPPFLPVLAILLGVLFGVFFSVVSWSLNRSRKGYAAQSHMVAQRYALLVSEQTDRAYKLLQGSAGNLSRKLQQRTRNRPRSGVKASTHFGSQPHEQPKFGVRLGDSPERPAAPSEVKKVQTTEAVEAVVADIETEIASTSATAPERGSEDNSESKN